MKGKMCFRAYRHVQELYLRLIRFAHEGLSNIQHTFVWFQTGHSGAFPTCLLRFEAVRRRVAL